MSLVGTRPILQDELQKYELHHRARIAIKPGITGMWQVSGRSDIGQLILILMILFKEKITEIIRKTKSVLITLAVSDSVFLFNATLLQIPFIQNIITNILHEDVGLTGRISAYAHAFLLISGSPIIGYVVPAGLLVREMQYLW